MGDVRILFCQEYFIVMKIHKINVSNVMGQGQRDRKLFWFDSKKDENTFIYYIYYNIYNI